MQIEFPYSFLSFGASNKNCLVELVLKNFVLVLVTTIVIHCVKCHNFHTRKPGKITVFYAVIIIVLVTTISVLNIVLFDLSINEDYSFYYNLDKISLSRSGSYIDSPKWLKNKKATINPKNNDDKCFQYALTVALNYEQIKKNPERIPKIEPFIDRYNWKEIHFDVIVKTGKGLNQIISQLLLIFCMCFIILIK